MEHISSSSISACTNENLNLEIREMDSKIVVEDEGIGQNCIDKTDSDLNSTFQEIFRDPSTFEFLLNVGNSKPHRDLRKISLYLKFDPYIGPPQEVSPNEDFIPLQTLEELDISNENNGAKGKNDSSAPNNSIELTDIADRTEFSVKSIDESHALPQNSSTKDTQSSPVSLNFSSCPSPIDRKETMKRELILLRRLLLQQDNTYTEDLKRYKKLVSAMQQSLQHSLERDMLLRKHLPENRIDKRQFQIIMEEYEKTITDLVTEKEKNQVAFKGKKQIQGKQLQSVKEHLVNTNKAFDDLQIKFDEMKNYNANEASKIKELNIQLIDYQYYVKELYENYEILKLQAEMKLQRANEDLALIEKNHRTEVSRLTALIKKSELRVNSLQEILEQKTKENRILMTMCDELINNQEGKGYCYDKIKR